MTKSSDPQKHKVKYEFMGPPGAAFIILSLPLTVYTLNLICQRDACPAIIPSSPDFLRFHNPFATNTSFSQFITTQLFSIRGTYLYLGWFFLNALLYFIVPGPIGEGQPLQFYTDSKLNTKRLKYPFNGLRCSAIAIAVVIVCVVVGLFPATVIYDEFLPIATTGILFSLLLSLYLYLESIFGKHDTPETMLAPHGNTGNVLYDFFIGRTLNPRIGFLDLKYFCELRPGLVGWVLINLSYACKQYEETGTITNSMILIILFQGYYVYDALSSESAILTTMDITTDGFGFMLVFGDLVWVPFTYTLQAHYLVEFPLQLPYWHLALIITLQIAGITIFRGANNQKNEFRSNPNSESSRKMKYITTEQGSKLLISGYWGIARHINYTGDLLMALSWCTCCGFTHPIPYFYIIYFFILLVHRERRDDDKCRNKYGKDWEKYCSIVKYRMFPYIY